MTDPAAPRLTWARLTTVAAWVARGVIVAVVVWSVWTIGRAAGWW